MAKSTQKSNWTKITHIALLFLISDFDPVTITNINHAIYIWYIFYCWGNENHNWKLWQSSEMKFTRVKTTSPVNSSLLDLSIQNIWKEMRDDVVCFCCCTSSSHKATTTESQQSWTVHEHYYWLKGDRNTILSQPLPRLMYFFAFIKLFWSICTEAASVAFWYFLFNAIGCFRAIWRYTNSYQ